jgi:hypothetical protein
LFFSAALFWPDEPDVEDGEPLLFIELPLDGVLLLLFP